MTFIYKLLNGKNILQDGGNNNKIPKHLEFIGTLWYIINNEKKMGKIPDNDLISVDFPDPLLPTITANSPGETLRFKLSKIGY